MVSVRNFYIWIAFSFKNMYYRAVVDMTTDEIREIKLAGSDINLLASPWRLSIGGHKLTVKQKRMLDTNDLVAVEIESDDDELTCRTTYVFYRRSPVIEVRRTLVPQRPATIGTTVEGAAIPQRQGSWRLEHSRRMLRQLRGTLLYEDGCTERYFGAKKFCPGWFDFAWREPSAGLGVALVENWPDAQSKIYDVTRYLDCGKAKGAVDRFQIFYIYDLNVQLSRPQHSFVLLFPHKGLDLAKERALSPLLNVLPGYVPGLERVRVLGE